MSQTKRIREIIAEQQGREHGSAFLVNAIRTRMGDHAGAAEVEDAVGFCRDIIDAVPVLVDRVRDAAQDNGVAPLVEPVLAHAEAYFINPLDALPEAMFGELGLLDDAYLALSVIRMLQTEPQPLIRIELDAPLSFLEQILGDSVLEQLQVEKSKAMAALMNELQRLAKAAEASRPQSAGVPPRQAVRPQSPRPTPAAQRRQCGACSGHGSVTCPSCYGTGSHARSVTRIDWRGETEFATEHIPCGCTGGYVSCGSCGGSGEITA